MDVARVIGRIVATRKDRRLEGVKICVIQPLDHQLRPARKPLVAIDPTALRGEGELVYFCESADAGFCNLQGVEFLPSDASIVGIIDNLDVNPAAAEF